MKLFLAGIRIGHADARTNRLGDEIEHVEPRPATLLEGKRMHRPPLPGVEFIEKFARRINHAAIILLRGGDG